MLELLLETLKTFDGVEFLIRETKTRRLESYNIKRQLEMRRNVETTRLDLILYVVFDEDGKKYRGSFNTEIHPGTSPGELSAKVEQGIYAAGFVRNEYYPLVMPVAAVPVPAPEAEVDAVRAMADLQAAFYADDDHKDGHISYAEFFITHSEVRILNSNGVDVSYVTRNVFVETAVHWRAGDGKEIEICESYRMSLSADTGAMLRDRVARLFAVAEKKSIAGPTPQVGDINILLTGECLAEFFDYYRSCANAEMVYQQLSTFKEGTVVQGPTGDRLTLTLEPGLEGSSCSRPYDESGLPLDCHTIIRDGTLLKYWGNTRFASYLGLAPTGGIGNIHVTGGTASGEDLRREPYLELVSFSHFQTDPITGNFGSEIRLGFYFDGEKTVPVTGGSISGNMATIRDGLRMSAEERQYDWYLGPATICIRGASISGVS